MSDKKIEYKFISESDSRVMPLEEKADKKMRFSGYLAVFGNVDNGGDVIEKGAFSDWLQSNKNNLPVLEQHGFLGTNGYNPIGYYELLKEDDYGLYVEGVLYSTDAGKNMYTVLKESPKGTMGQSIGYWIEKSRYPSDEETRRFGVWRYIEKAGLREGSIVTFPMNEKARVDDVKSASLFWRQMETHFRENGFSREDAKKAISLIKSSTPNNAFANFLSMLGSVPVADDSATQDKPESLKGENELLAALNEVKKGYDIAEFKKVLNSFSMK